MCTLKIKSEEKLNVYYILPPLILLHVNLTLNSFVYVLYKDSPPYPTWFFYLLIFFEVFLYEYNICFFHCFHNIKSIVCEKLVETHIFQVNFGVPVAWKSSIFNVRVCKTFQFNKRLKITRGYTSSPAQITTYILTCKRYETCNFL